MSFSNTYDTANPGSAVGNRESLLSELTILAPEETPVLSMAPKGTATASYHEWVVDLLEDPITTGVLEGADVTSFDDKFANRAKLGNRMQKFRRNWKVSDEQEAITSVGPAGVAAAEIKSQREIKRDIEASLCSDNDRTTGTAGTAATLRGFGDWLDSGGPSDVPTGYRMPAASLEADGANLTETELGGLIDSMYNENGEVNRTTGVFATALRRATSDFTRSLAAANGTYQVTQSADSKKITLAVSTYESDHGIISLVTGNPKCMAGDAYRGYLLNTSHYGVDTLKPMGAKRLENQGGGERGFTDCILTLRVGSPLAHGKITV